MLNWVHGSGLALVAAVAGAAAQAQPAASGVTLATNPERVCLERRQDAEMNFDLSIRNDTPRAVTVRQLEASVFDARGEMVERRIVWQDAMSVLGPHRTVKPGELGILFNPFAFRTAREGVRIRYEAQFEDAPAAAVWVEPKSCVSKTRLILPVTGRLMVFDGYDFLSHHRRSDFQVRADMRAFGVVDNWYRYGIDLIHIDAEGKMFRGEGSRLEDWHAWGQPVRAPADGVVRDVRSDRPDNDALTENRWTPKRLSEDEMNTDGNYVLIDHGGEFSLLTHLRQGSVRVRAGERVRAGQLVAEVGNSGSTHIPHMHYELRTPPGLGVRQVRSLQAWFHGLRVLGQPQTRGPMAPNTGDVLIAR